MNNPNGPAIPAWLLEKNEFVETPAPSRTHFLAHTLRNISDVFETEFFSERYAGKPLLLQSVDPRVKLIVLIAFIVFSSFTSSLVVLLVLAGVALLYAKFSGLPIKDYARRIWCYVPVLVFVFSLPGASGFFVRGSPLFTLLPPGALGLKAGLSFSAAGLQMAFRLALRAGISLSFGALLLLTTRWARVTGALAALKVPLIFLSILNMAYRYIFVISAMAGDMLEARYLRTVGRLETAENRRFMSHSIAHLFLKSHFLSEEIFDAMVCRGFTGKPVGLETDRIRSTDVLFAVNNAVILLVLLIGEHLF